MAKKHKLAFNIAPPHCTRVKPRAYLLRKTRSDIPIRYGRLGAVKNGGVEVRTTKTSPESELYNYNNPLLADNVQYANVDYTHCVQTVKM